MAKPGRPRKVIAQIVWLGEPDVLETVWNEITFRAGVPVSVSDPWMVKKAKGNPYFEVIEPNG
jgi:hypothetical protein